MNLQELKEIAIHNINYAEATGTTYSHNYKVAKDILQLIDNFDKVCKQLEWVESTLNIDVEKEMEHEAMLSNKDEDN